MGWPPFLVIFRHRQKYNIVSNDSKSPNSARNAKKLLAAAEDAVIPISSKALKLRYTYLDKREFEKKSTRRVSFKRKIFWKKHGLKWFQKFFLAAAENGDERRERRSLIFLKVT